MKGARDGGDAVVNNNEPEVNKPTPPSMSTGWKGVYFALNCGATVDHGGQDDE